MAEEEHPTTPEEEAEFLERLEEQIRRMKVSDHLAYIMDSLAALAGRKLGLTPETVEERDLDQARLAIEAFRALLQVVEPERPMQEVNAHRATLSQLQVAYVKATELPAAGAPAPEPEEEEETSAECDTADEGPGEEAVLPENGTLPLED